MKQIEKINIAECLVEAIQTEVAVDDITHKFIVDWICSGPEEKSKDMLDVWDIVLKNYYPEDRPVLFRVTDFINDGKIESYTGRLGVAEVFLRQCGEEAKLIICDTEEYMVPKQFRLKGDYIRTFYPLGKLLKNEMKLEDSLFIKSFMSRYIGEDEYIMRTDSNLMFIGEVKR